MKKTIILIMVIFLFFLCSCAPDSLNEAIVKPIIIDDCEIVTPIEYDLLIENYIELVNIRLSEDFEEKYNNDEDVLKHINSQYVQEETVLYYNWNCMIIEMVSYKEQNVTFNYYFEDLNNDGVNEAICLKNNNTILAIFSIVNNKICLLDAFWSKYSCSINEGNIYIVSSGGVNCSYYVKQVVNQSSELKTIREFEIEETAQGSIYYQIENDIKKEISEVVFYQLTSDFNK